jgi:Holliday junction DNA helicase RuvB
MEEYIGQEHAKELASVMVEAADKEGRPLPNILISGSAGLGKTTLAKLILNGKTYNFTDGNSANTRERFAGYLIIDEIHNVRPEICDRLNTVLDAGGLRIIGATTNPGLLPAPFRSRFRTLPLVPYTVDDLTKIQYNVVDRKGITAQYRLLEEISKRGRFTPRRTLQYLAFIMDLMAVRDETTLTEQTLLDGLDMIGVDEKGLVEIDHRYLEALPDDRPVGLQYLQAILQTDKDTIEEEIEPYLLQMKLIDRSARGRFKVTSLEDQLQDSLDAVFKNKGEEN